MNVKSHLRGRGSLGLGIYRSFYIGFSVFVQWKKIETIGLVKRFHWLMVVNIKETILRKSEENSRCWRFLADRIIIFDYAKEADAEQKILIFSPHIFKIFHINLYLQWKISIIYMLSLWNLFETEIVANGAIPASINKIWENGEVFLNFSTFCWNLDFLSIVSLVSANSWYLLSKKSVSNF